MAVNFGQVAGRTLGAAPGQHRTVPQFQSYAAGRKVYGGGRRGPNVGMTASKAGYGKRDGAMAARRQAFLDRAKGFS
jgi:hypothetical protein